MNENGLTTAADIWQLLVRSSVDRKHPWRVVGLSTQGPEGPSSRNVILRKVHPQQRRLVFFTDARSNKLQDIRHCPRVALLFWNPQHQLQLRAVGVAATEVDCAIVDQWWQTVPEHARRDYGSRMAPGDMIAGQEAGQYDLSVAREFFTVLNIELDRFDVLHLSREQHSRKRFVWNMAAGEWGSDRLVP